MAGVASGRGRVHQYTSTPFGWGWGGGWGGGPGGGLDNGRLRSAALQWVWPEYLWLWQVLGTLAGGFRHWLRIGADLGSGLVDFCTLPR